jgi:hypothetical protein
MNTEKPPAKPQKKASIGQVAVTMFWGLCMIGKKDTWERDGIKITLAQAIIGALIAGCVVVTVLVLLVRFATR